MYFLLTPIHQTLSSYLSNLQFVESDSEEIIENHCEAASSSQTLLITHPARKCVFEFLRVIMTDSLVSPTASKGQVIIDSILEVIYFSFVHNFFSSFPVYGDNILESSEL